MEPRKLKRLVWAVGLLLGGLPAPHVVRAQESAVRLEITGVADSTFTIQVKRYPWVRRGTAGIVVDPKRREALVARFSVLGVQGGLATALITGTTTDVKREDIALIELPGEPWYRQNSFWGGLAVGALVGVALRSAAH